jgi:hypothetical protein
MSFFPAKDPAAGDAAACDAIDLVLVPRSVDLGDFAVRRALPHASRRMIGPFIFFDHFGPAEFCSGAGLDVRPHPHIGLATVTYLYRGEIVHRDSLGNTVVLEPGAVNWMNAGRGIAHSERSGEDRSAPRRPLHGLQLWVALPAAAEESEPGFWHHTAPSFPVVEDEGKRVRVLVGSLYGVRSPVKALWETVFADVSLAAGARLPLDAEPEERGLYLVAGDVAVEGDRFAAGRLLVLRPGDRLTVRAITDAQLVIVGGAPMDGPRHIWWNFVSSRQDRIEQAKAEWKAGRFGKVAGDEAEFIPLPEG